MVNYTHRFVATSGEKPLNTLVPINKNFKGPRTTNQQFLSISLPKDKTYSSYSSATNGLDHRFLNAPVTESKLELSVGTLKQLQVRFHRDNGYI